MTQRSDGEAHSVATADRGDRDRAATDASTSKFPGLDAIVGCALLVVIIAHSASVHDAVALAHPQFFGVAWRVGAALTRLDIGVDIAVMALAFRVYLPFAQRIQAGRPSPETVRWWWKSALRIFPAYWIALCVVVGVSSRQSLLGTEQWLAHLTAIQGYVPSLWDRSTQGLRGGEFVGVIVSVAVAAPAFAYCARRLNRRFAVVTVDVAMCAMLVGCGAGFAALDAKHRLWAPFRVFSPYVALTAVGFSFAAKFARRPLVSSSPRRSPFNQVQVGSRGLVRAMWAIALGLYIVMVQTVASHPSGASSVGELVVERWLRLVIAALVVSSVISVDRYTASESAARSASNAVSRWSLVPALRRLGVVAFGAYLWHWAIIDALRAHVGANSWLSFAFIALVAAASSAMFGIVSSFAIDRPIMRGFARCS